MKVQHTRQQINKRREKHKIVWNVQTELTITNLDFANKLKFLDE